MQRRYSAFNDFTSVSCIKDIDRYGLPTSLVLSGFRRTILQWYYQYQFNIGFQ